MSVSIPADIAERIERHADVDDFVRKCVEEYSIYCCLVKGNSEVLGSEYPHYIEKMSKL